MNQPVRLRLVRGGRQFPETRFQLDQRHGIEQLVGQPDCV